MFVLDEADEMLSRGFKDQIYDIFQLLPPKLQVGGCQQGWRGVDQSLTSCDLLGEGAWEGWGRVGQAPGLVPAHSRHPCGQASLRHLS